MNDFYIRILKFAESRETFTIDELSNEIEMSEAQKNFIIRQVDSNRLFVHETGNFMRRPKSPVFMSMEDKFRLIEYTELKEARESSKRATYFASCALLVSLASTLFSIYFSFESRNSEVIFPSEITKSILNIDKKLVEFSKSLSITNTVSSRMSQKESVGKAINVTDVN